MDSRWEHFEHQADVGLRGLGATKAEAFEQVALAMTAVITDPALVRPAGAVTICCEAADDGLLLVNWLNALVYEMDTRRMLFSRFSVRISGCRLDGVAWGEPMDAARHQPAVEVKAATNYAVEVAQVEGGGWKAQCVVDV